MKIILYVLRLVVSLHIHVHVVMLLCAVLRAVGGLLLSDHTVLTHFREEYSKIITGSNELVRQLNCVFLSMLKIISV